VLGLFEHLCPEFRLVRELATMPVEVIAREFRQRPARTPACGEKILADASGQHGEGGVIDARHGKPFGADAEAPGRGCDE
jgi:hypothetical protein